MLRFAADLLQGALTPARALARLVRTPGLWPCLVVPVLLNVALMALLTGLLLLPAWRWVDAHVGTGGMLQALARIVMLLGILLGIGLLVLQCGSVLGAPWYETLSVRLEEMTTGRTVSDPPFRVAAALRDVGRALGFQMRKLLLLCALGGPLLIVGLLPVAGPVLGGVGWFFLGALMIFLEVVDPPLERRRWRFRDKLGLFWKQFPGSLGLAAACLLLLGLPLLNLAAVPVCVAAGTLFYCERQPATAVATPPAPVASAIGTGGGHPALPGKEPA